MSGEHLERGLRRSSGCGAALVAQTVKNLPAVQETGVQFLGREDPLEKEEPGRLQSMGLQRVGHN